MSKFNLKNTWWVWACNQLTESEKCFVETVIPKEKIVCNNNYNIINDNITEIKSLDSLDKELISN